MSPQYLYECKSCEQRVLVIHDMKSANIPLCIECGQSMSRRYDFGAVKFVGKGFASND